MARSTPGARVRAAAAAVLAAALCGGALTGCDAALAESDASTSNARHHPGRTTAAHPSGAGSATGTGDPAATGDAGAGTTGGAGATASGDPGDTMNGTAAGPGDHRGPGREHPAHDPDGGMTAAAPDPNCTITVPAAPLTAEGLATPYRLTATDRGAGPCHEANADQSAFVEATILDPATGRLSIYHPLVVDAGTAPAVPPVAPTLPPGAVVGVWFGFQGDVLTLRGGSGCVNGLPGSPFGQFAYCGAPAFFAAANAAIRAGKLTVPALGTGADGLPCPTTRDFAVVDQDQSDNLTTTYVVEGNGRIAQDNAMGRALGGTKISNASDNGLLATRLDPALGCHPFTAPDLTAGGEPSPSLALNELQAAATQRAPVALVPPNDPMAKVDDRTSVTKTNLYRAGADMPPLNPTTDTGAAYCADLKAVAPQRLAADKQFLVGAASPDPAAKNLFEFLTQRLTASWKELGCRGRAPRV